MGNMKPYSVNDIWYILFFKGIFIISYQKLNDNVFYSTIDYIVQFVFISNKSESLFRENIITNKNNCFIRRLNWYNYEILKLFIVNKNFDDISKDGFIYIILKLLNYVCTWHIHLEYVFAFHHKIYKVSYYVFYLGH